MFNRHLPNSATTAPISPSPLALSLAGFAALAVAMGIGRFAFTPVLPMMLQDTTLTIKAGAWLASGNYVGYLIGALGATVLRLHPLTAIRIGLVTISVATLAMGLPLPFAAWLLLRFLAGVASAWVLISVSSWSLGTFSPATPFFTSLVFAGVGAGIAAAGLLCLALIEYHTGSCGAWFALGLSALIITAGIWRYFGEQGSASSEKTAQARQSFSWNIEAAKLVCCYGVFGFGYIIPATFLPVMAKNVMQQTSAFGWSWPIFGVAAAVSTLFVSTLRQHMSNRRLWLISQWIMAAGILLPAIRPQLLTIFASALCVGGTFMVITLVAVQEAKRMAGSNATPLIAGMTSAFACGQIIGPMAVRSGSDGSANFTFGLIVSAVLLIASTFLLRHGQHEQ